VVPSQGPWVPRALVPVPANTIASTHRVQPRVQQAHQRTAVRHVRRTEVEELVRRGHAHQTWIETRF